MDHDCGTFRNDFISINEIGKREGSIFVDELRLVFLEPFVFLFFIVFDLLIRKSCILKQVSDPFSQPANGPVPQNNCIGGHDVI